MATGPRDVPPVEKPGLFVADVTGEIAEMIFNDAGIEIPEGFRRVFHLTGLDNPFIIAGLDLLIRTKLRRDVENPVTREILIQISDAVMDKFKALPDSPTLFNLEQAKGRAIAAGLSKMKEIKAKQTARPSFEALFGRLGILYRTEYMHWIPWMNVNAKQRFETWMKLRGKIETVDFLQDLTSVAFGEDMKTKTEERIQVLEGFYGHKPNVLETLESAVRGEDTIHTKKLNEFVSSALRDLQSGNAATKAKNAADKLRYGF